MLKGSARGEPCGVADDLSARIGDLCGASFAADSHPGNDGCLAGAAFLDIRQHRFASDRQGLLTHAEQIAWRLRGKFDDRFVTVRIGRLNAGRPRRIFPPLAMEEIITATCNE